ncbi:unnamed protein product [Caenorhabditis brenneri]
MIQNKTVLLNLRDSVSRIVYNLGFTSIDVTAHARLVGLLADKLETMSHTSRGLLENSGRNANSLNPIDLKHVFRINHVDIQGLCLYTESVTPFPPAKSEIHVEKQTAQDEKKQETLEKPTSTMLKVPLKRHPTPPIVEFPVFDDLTDVELGFLADDPPENPIIPTSEFSKPPATILEPPPPPPPLPPLFFSPPSSVYCPPFIPMDWKFSTMDGASSSKFVPNYTTPDFIPLNVHVHKPDPMAHIEKPSLKEPHGKTEASKPKPRKYGQKLEKTASNSSIVPAKMTKKRLMQTNYERRLRNEQMANEERKKEKKYEKRRAEQEKIKKVDRRLQKTIGKTEKPMRKDEKSKGYVPSSVIKSKSGAYDVTKKQEKEGKQAASTETRSTIAATTTKMNENKKNGSTTQKIVKLENPEVSENAIASREPLPKIKISFRRMKHGDTGVLIKRVQRISYYLSNGEWKTSEYQWKSSNGVYSKPVEPRRPKPGNSTKDRIPKLKLIKNADNSYSKA